jgi:hypothetical protein
MSNGNSLVLNTLGGSSVNFNNVVPLNKWVNIAGTFNGTTTTLYVNGTYVNSTNVLGTPNSGSNTNLIGQANGFPKFNGKVDEVMILNRALSAEEILSIYNDQK